MLRFPSGITIYIPFNFRTAVARGRLHGIHFHRSETRETDWRRIFPLWRRCTCDLFCKRFEPQKILMYVHTRLTSIIACCERASHVEGACSEHTRFQSIFFYFHLVRLLPVVSFYLHFFKPVIVTAQMCV